MQVKPIESDICKNQGYSALIFTDVSTGIRDPHLGQVIESDASRFTSSGETKSCHKGTPTVSDILVSTFTDGFPEILWLSALRLMPILSATSLVLMPCCSITSLILMAGKL